MRHSPPGLLGEKRHSPPGLRRHSPPGLRLATATKNPGFRPHPSASSLSMPRASRWQGQAPRDSLLHPLWEPAVRGEPCEAAFIARCLLGQGVVGANRRLSMLDLRVWAALCTQLHEQLPHIEPEAPELRDLTVRTVETTGYQLAERVFAEDGGHEYRKLRAALVRLAATRACVRVVERDPELAAELVREGYVSLVGDIWLATTRLNLHSAREWGALKGSTSLKVEIGYWPAQQIVAGRCTWLDLDLLRALGSGLAARAWVALEGWARWPQRSLDGREECAIGLGQPALQSLGVGGYKRPRAARAALDRAGAQIVAVDSAYELVRCERRSSGWCFVVRRIAGARARADARKEGFHRDAGIAAKKHRRQAERAERRVVREIVRQSLRDSSEGGAGELAA